MLAELLLAREKGEKEKKKRKKREIQRSLVFGK